jgi:hypothetical protein
MFSERPTKFFSQPLSASDNEGSSSASSSVDDSWASASQVPVKPQKPPKPSKRLSTTSSHVSSRRSSVQAHCETCTCFRKQRKVSDKITTYSLFTKCICYILKDRPDLCPETGITIRSQFIAKVWKLVKPKLGDKQGSVLKTEADKFYKSLMNITVETINRYMYNKSKKKKSSLI